MHAPMESQLNTVSIPAIGTDPAVLYRAVDRPIRLMVRNIGGNVLFLSHEASTLNQAPPVLAGTYQLPPGGVDVFVLQPRQGMVASGSGAGGFASIAVSEALPMSWGES